MWVSYRAVHFEIIPKVYLYACQATCIFQHMCADTAVDIDKQASTSLASVQTSLLESCLGVDCRPTAWISSLCELTPG